MKGKDNNMVKVEHKNLFLRIISSFVLFLIFGTYISLAILNNESWVHLNNKTLSFVFGGLFIIFTLLFVFLCFVEMIKLFKIKNKFAIFSFFIVGVALYLLPLGDAASLESSLFIYSYSKSLIAFLASPILQTFSFLALIGAFLFIGKLIGLQMIDAFWLTLFLVVIVFGFKGYTTICLSVDYDYLNLSNPYSGIKYGYFTSIWIWLGIVLTDTFAFIFGSAWGKHKLAPKISPKKTWEGAIGGFIVSIIISIALALLLYFMNTGVNIFNQSIANLDTWLVVVLIIILAILISIISQLGDLLFSFAKRKAEIKDFSNLIPGHGGILDRLDSFIVVFALFFVITLFI